jgi:uncharacterized tellurite resistance protein B-like protein
MNIMKMLGLKPVEDAHPEADTVRRIAEELDKLDPERARYVAAFAFILSRVAGADQEVSAAETGVMERLVMEKGGLPREQAIIVVQMAKTQHLLFGGTEDFLVTREFDRLATPEQKLALIDCLFAVSASDDTILTVEDNEIMRIVNELKVEHQDVVQLRARYRDKLEAARGLGK